MATKHFILSTRTLLSKRNVTLSFGEDNIIYVPLSVMEELEAKYYDQIDERGKIARETLAYLGNFHIEELKKGVIQENGSILKVAINYNEVQLPDVIRETECTKLDKRILQTCLGIRNEIPENESVVLVSKRATLRKKAELLGIQAQTFRDELLPEISEQYTGRRVLNVSDSQIRQFDEKSEISIKDVFKEEDIKDIYQNMFIKLQSKNSQAYGRVYEDKIIALSFDRYYPYRVIPMNDGQRFMIEALMLDCRIAPLVIIKGPAGTGKTHITLAAGLEKVLEKREFSKNILISRSATEVGEKIGHLPGTEQEKMDPYVRGIRDNLEELLGHTPNVSRKNAKATKKHYNDDEDDNYKPMSEDGTIFFENGLIKVEAINYIRGRSITQTYIIIDEVQNLTAGEVKTIITRVGKGTKLILMGNPEQIDRPYLDERNNGLSYASERMKGEPTCWQITMTDEESVRSELARRASKLL